jgi:uncharacterized membrane protein YraQ (UPF0718 family)
MERLYGRKKRKEAKNKTKMGKGKLKSNTKIGKQNKKYKHINKGMETAKHFCKQVVYFLIFAVILHSLMTLYQPHRFVALNGVK